MALEILTQPNRRKQLASRRKRSLEKGVCVGSYLYIDLLTILLEIDMADTLATFISIIFKSYIDITTAQFF